MIGAGPNGLAAAIVLAQAGRSVLLVEAKATIGGGARSAELTRPGFVHDVCAAIHPTGVVSPFLRTLPLQRHGLEWIHPPSPLAHPQDDGTAAMLERSFDDTARSLGADGPAWRSLFEPFAAQADALYAELLAPPGPSRHPFLMMRFGMNAFRAATGLARTRFRGAHARALFAGCAAHSILPLEQLFTAAFGIVLGVAGHAIGWPCARGGTQQITEALASYLKSLGGTIQTDRPIASMRDLPAAKAYLFDVGPHQLARIAGERLPDGYRRRLMRYRYGPAAFKVDWALDGPVPWRAPEVARAATVHVGGTLEQIADAEAAVWRGEHPERPFVLVAQQSLFDATRAPAGKHTGWAYCHVPPGSTVDMTARLEAQIERFAPGFRDRILARHTMSPGAYEAYNENYVGGDIAGGVSDIWQLFTRPVARIPPYSTPNPSIWMCSASTPPGGGVHGMCGYYAARAALRRVFGQRLPPL